MPKNNPWGTPPSTMRGWLVARLWRSLESVVLVIVVVICLTKARVTSAGFVLALIALPVMVIAFVLEAVERLVSPAAAKKARAWRLALLVVAIALAIAATQAS